VGFPRCALGRGRCLCPPSPLSCESHDSVARGAAPDWSRSIENRKVFAEGRRLTKGYCIDFIGNFDRSAKDGLLIYRISEVLGSFGLRALIRKVAVVCGSRR
jgi:hypothetical protein